jgi:Glycerol dehydrogenase and related enzymes
MRTIIRSPLQYVQGAGILEDLYNQVAFLAKTGVYVIAGNSAMKKLETAIRNSFDGKGLKLELRKFGGECSQREVDAICADVRASGCDLVVGLGGGKTLDTAKAVSYFLDLPVAIAPSAASSDAPCSALSVLYHDNGSFDKYLGLKSNPDIILMDSKVIAEAPPRLLVAGMGDALATYYEAKACYDSGAVSIAGGTCSETALAIAETCRNILFTHGARAKIAVENQFVTPDLNAVIEANTYLSGVGFESGGLAAAHSIHNGLTVLEETHAMLHGEKVAFGTLVHMVLSRAPDEEFCIVRDFCMDLGLPVTLEELGIVDPTREKIMAVAAAACAEGETIHNMPHPVTKEDVCAAIYIADQLCRDATSCCHED